MRVEFSDNMADGLDIPAPARCRVAVTIHDPPRPALPPALALLTDGQRDCLRLVYRHMTSKDIARVLGVSPHTVDMRLRTAMRTLSVASRIEAARLLVLEEAGGDILPDAYQPLVYHRPEIAGGAEMTILTSPTSTGGDGLAHHDHHLRDRSDVGPPASGPPRLAGASVPFESEYQPDWAGATTADPGIGTRPLIGSAPWGKRNDLAIGVRLLWILMIAVGSSLAFGAILAALAALKALI